MSLITFEQMAREFPDYDQSTLPAIPAEWVDVSWHNDSCPSFEVASYVDSRVYVFIDYADSAAREFEDGSRFSVVKAMANTGETETYLETDDFAAVLAVLADPDVKDEETAKAFLTDLHARGLAYHPEDSAADCLSSHGLTEVELVRIQVNMTACFDYVEPCGFILDLLNKDA